MATRASARGTGEARPPGRAAVPPPPVPRAGVHRLRSPTSTRATSRRTSPAARSSATCCVWVIVASNLMAMLDPDALGEARHRHRAATSPRSAARASRGARAILLWLQAEVIAMATDLAEFLGAALGFHLLFGIGLFPAAILTGDRGVRDPRPAALRLPAARGDDRGDGRRDRRLLRDRALLREPAAPGRRPKHAVVPQFAGTESRAARGRDPRRDRDAARDLPALGADAGPRSCPKSDERGAAAVPLHADRRGRSR